MKNSSFNATHQETSLERIERKLDKLLETISNAQPAGYKESMALLDVVDVATLCKVAQGSVYNWVYARKIKYCKANGRLLFRIEDVQDFLSTQQFIKKGRPRKKG